MLYFYGVRDLSAEVRKWKYRVTMVPDLDEPALTGRFLTLKCRTSEAHFMRHGTELSIHISEENQRATCKKVVMTMCGKSLDATEIGQITHSSINEYEEKVPTYLEGYFKTSAEHFQHILDIFNNAQEKKFIKVTLELSLYGLDLGYEVEMDEWPEERMLSIVNVKFCLERHPEKEN